MISNEDQPNSERAHNRVASDCHQGDFTSVIYIPAPPPVEFAV